MSDELVYALLEQKYGTDGADEIIALRQQLAENEALVSEFIDLSIRILEAKKLRDWDEVNDTVRELCDLSQRPRPLFVEM